MASDRLFLDTSYVVARFNRRDQYHMATVRLAQRLDQSREVWTSEAVLLEVANAFSQPGHRAVAVQLWDQFHGGARNRLVPMSGPNLEQAIQLFRARSDKAWSLTDCISFVVMAEHQLTDALTCDQHFVQAGFRALLLEESP